jgi:hypothetical protein
MEDTKKGFRMREGGMTKIQDRHAVSWVSAADRFRLVDMSYDDKKWELRAVVN